MRTFTDVLRDLPGGRTVDELSSALAKLALAVSKTGKKGTLTLKLDVIPNGETMLTIEDTITVKVPQQARGRGVFFFDQEGSLLKSDPRQKEMELKVVGGPKGEPRRIDAAAAATRLEEMQAEDKASVG